MNNLPHEHFEKIFNYLKSSRLSENSITRYLSSFEDNPDIAQEFCNWIDTRNYQPMNALVIEGYSAFDIYSKATYLDGLKVYTIMIKLRKDPERTKKEIENGLLGY